MILKSEEAERKQSIFYTPRNFSKKKIVIKTQEKGKQPYFNI